MRVTARAVAVELFPPFHHVAATAVFRDQLAHLIATLAPAFAAFDAQHVELAFDVAGHRAHGVSRMADAAAGREPRRQAANADYLDALRQKLAVSARPPESYRKGSQ